MADRVLHDTETLTIAHNATENWLHLDWKGNPTDEQVVAGALRLLDVLRQEGCAKVLNDNTNMHGLWAEAARWGGEVFFPQLYDAGCRSFAWIQSPERFSQLSAELALQHTTAGIIFMMFRAPTTAAAWLHHM